MLSSLSNVADFSTLKVSGKDSTDFLNRLCTRDLASVGAGEGLNSAILGNRGEVLFLFYLVLQKKGEWLIFSADVALYDYLNQRLFVEEVELRKAIGERFVDLPSTFSNDEGYYFLIKKVMEQIKGRSILELDLLDWVDEDQGCYPGQEVTTRFLTQGKAFFQRVCVVYLQFKSDFSKKQFDEVVTKLEDFFLLDKSYLKSKELVKLGEVLGVGCSSQGMPYLVSSVKKRDLSEKGEVSRINLSDFIEIDCVAEIELMRTRPLGFLGEGRDKREWQDLFEKGMSHYHADELGVAKGFLEQALKLERANPDVLEVLALIYEKQGDVVEAIKYNQRFAKSDPTAVMARTNLSRLYMLQGNIKEAEDEKQKATVLMFRSTAKPQKSMNEGKGVEEELRLKKLSEQNRKLEIFSQVLELDSDDETAHFGKGKIYYEQKKYSSAESHLKRVVEVKPNYSIAYQYLSETYMAMKDLERAREVAIQGIVVAEKQGDLMPLKVMERVMKGLKEGQMNKKN